jgi:hypothetical protein
VNELLPMVSGLVLGAVLGLVRPSLRLPVGAVFAVALGTRATVVSGEFRLSWGFLLIDIPLVGVAAAIGLLLTSRLRSASADRR